jgi:adenylate kinase family enzyme
MVNDMMWPSSHKHVSCPAHNCVCCKPVEVRQAANLTPSQHHMKLKASMCCLCAGDLLRAEVASGSDTGRACESLMKNGLLVPISVTLTLLKNAMIKSGAKDFLIDGFPRALDQAHEFEASIKPCEYVLFLECSEQEMEKRLLRRGQTSGRSDDNAETIRKRFHTFVTQSLPVIDHYEALNKCHKISSLPPPDEVFQDICKVLGPAPGAAAEEASVAAVETPVVAEHVPAAAEEVPAAAEDVPAAAEEVPAAAKHLPAAAEEVPAAAEHLPAAAEEVPAAAVATPAEEAAAPVAEEVRHGRDA